MKVQHSGKKVPAPVGDQRRAILKNMAVSGYMVEAAQGSYDRGPDYGLTDADMAKAIKAALRAAVRYGK